MSEFVEVEWFGRKDKIGIVLTHDKFDGFKARMSPLREQDWASDLPPSSEESDIKYLMEHATKIPFEWAWGIFKNRMIAFTEDRSDNWPIKSVRYDHRDYDITTLEEVT